MRTKGLDLLLPRISALPVGECLLKDHRIHHKGRNRVFPRPCGCFLGHIVLSANVVCDFGRVTQCYLEGRKRALLAFLSYLEKLQSLDKKESKMDFNSRWKG